MKIAIIGTRGIPAIYGGFETLAEKLAEELSNEFDITVYCSSKYYTQKLTRHKGARLRYFPIGANGFQGIIYDSVALIESLPRFDKVILLGAPAGFLLPLFGKLNKKIIFNYGGLDFNRSKWNGTIQRFVKFGKDIATKFSGQVVADNKGIQDFIFSENKRESILIPYGANHVQEAIITEQDKVKYPFLNEKYALVVARIQKDNNIELILNAFKKSKELTLVVIGNWSNSKWGINLKKSFSNIQNIVLLDAIYDQKELDKIRRSCYLYIHGHSAGGTNPSLVEAMFLGLPVISYGSIFNKYTSLNKAIYFENEKQLLEIIQTISKKTIEEVSKNLKEIAIQKYTWNKVAHSYKVLIEKD